MDPVSLREAEKLEVTILVDNYTDMLLLQSSEVLRRPAVPPPNFFIAEHGFSCLIKASAGSEEHTVLMDVGISGTCLLHNADLLKIDLSKVESVIISHGHFDHFWALQKAVGRFRKGIPLILHPEAFLQRRINISALGVQTEMPSLDENSLKDRGTSDTAFIRFLPHKNQRSRGLFSLSIEAVGQTWIHLL
jgi:7,8-dihydropterin-6-yl-methyl-4-(beta-D-ribofuranosyl)aminobenzene 5'-phosphate synthase